MEVARRALPGGEYRITGEENATLCRAVGSEPDPRGVAHPIFYYVATQIGMGISVGDLLALCDCDVADGTLMAGSSVRFAGELRVDEDYIVSGEIVSLIRKSSRTFGAVDLLSFELCLTDRGGAQVLECTNQWLLPRRGVTQQ